MTTSGVAGGTVAEMTAGPAASTTIVSGDDSAPTPPCRSTPRAVRTCKPAGRAAGNGTAQAPDGPGRTTFNATPSIRNSTRTPARAAASGIDPTTRDAGGLDAVSTVAPSIAASVPHEAALPRSTGASTPFSVAENCGGSGTKSTANSRRDSSSSICGGWRRFTPNRVPRGVACTRKCNRFLGVIRASRRRVITMARIGQRNATNP